VRSKSEAGSKGKSKDLSHLPHHMREEGRETTAWESDSSLQCAEQSCRAGTGAGENLSTKDSSSSIAAREGDEGGITKGLSSSRQGREKKKGVGALHHGPRPGQRGEEDGSGGGGKRLRSSEEKKGHRHGSAQTAEGTFLAGAKGEARTRGGTRCWGKN